MEKVKKLDWEKALSEGIEGKSGKVYRFESEMSAKRWFEASKYRVHMSHGLPDVRHYHEALMSSYNDLNTGKLADGIVKLNRLIEATHQLSNRVVPGLMLCALYFNHEQEDRMGYNETDLMQKVQDWEHYDVSGFFLLAFKLCNLPAKLLNASIQKSFAEMEGVKVEEALKNK